MQNQPVGTARIPSSITSSRLTLAPFRLHGRSLGLADDVAALEACLSLEHAVGADRGDSQGLESPAAVPYCQFLTLRDGQGALEGMCRILAHGPGIPVENPLASERFHRSPLLTALRYSRREILEMGPIAVGPGREAASVAAFIWEGMMRMLDRHGSVILLGRDRLPLDVSCDLSAVLADHGPPPDLETEAREGFRNRAGSGPRGKASGRGLPGSLQEALRRGGCLAAEPILSPDRKAFEIIWIALPEVLGVRPDWSA